MAAYPLSKFHFEVAWGGSRIGFTEVTGLLVETEMIEYSEGVNREYSSVKIPGRKKNGNITLKRGVFPADNEFFQWWNSAKLNTIERRDITISLLNENHEAVMVWKARQVWPTKITAPDLKADANEIAIETIELAHEGLTIQNE